MTPKAEPPADSKPAAAGKFFSAKNRYLSPLLLTAILIPAQLSFGILESLTRTLLAIATSVVFEVALGRLVRGAVPHLASAYMSGISVGILLRSPEFWPYALCSALSTTSKYAIRWHDRHLWNPSNFAICAMLLLAPEYVAALSIQWGNESWAMLVIWVLGAVITYRVGYFHITVTYVISFLLFAALRSAVTGHSYIAEIAPLTGPMYQLYIFFMITDPKTTVRPRWAQYLVTVLIAAVETVLRLAESIYAPFYALTIVGPAAMAIETWTMSKRKQ